MGWVGLDWTGLGWTALHWTWRDWMGLVWTRSSPCGRAETSLRRRLGLKISAVAEAEAQRWAVRWRLRLKGGLRRRLGLKGGLRRRRLRLKGGVRRRLRLRRTEDGDERCAAASGCALTSNSGGSAGAGVSES